jgi:endonuclease/exonuclease/phosphatase family metal-dependent hydrolase
MPRRKSAGLIVLAVFAIMAAALFLSYNQDCNCSYTGYFCAPSNPPPVNISESDTIKIATWNVQNWGEKKAENSTVMEAIADNLKGYDIIAIQEISNFYEKSDPSCPKIANICPGNSKCSAIRNALQDYLNDQRGLNYSFVFSDQVRDERYLYIYNPQKLTLLSSELVSDSEEEYGPVCDLNKTQTGKMVRQPFKAVFQAGNFTFTLLNAHTSPSKNVAELNGLEYFYRQEESNGAKNIIVLGDLNADCDYLAPFDNIAFRNSQYIWGIPDGTDTTISKKSCTYDRLIFKNDVNLHYTGSYNVSRLTTSAESDHYLVWAVFSIPELNKSSSQNNPDLVGQFWKIFE